MLAHNRPRHREAQPHSSCKDAKAGSSDNNSTLSIPTFPYLHTYTHPFSKHLPSVFHPSSTFKPFPVISPCPLHRPPARTQARAHEHTRGHARALTHAHPPTHAPTHTHTHTHTPDSRTTHTHPPTHTRGARARTLTHARTQARARARTHAPTRARKHARMRARTHARRPARLRANARTPGQVATQNACQNQTFSFVFAVKAPIFMCFSCLSRPQQDAVWKAAPSNIPSITSITGARPQTCKPKAADPKTSPKTHPPEADDAGDAHHFPFHASSACAGSAERCGSPIELRSRALLQRTKGAI